MALIGIIGGTVTGNIITDTALYGIRVTNFFDASEGDAVGGNITVTGNEIYNSGLYSGPALPGAVLDGISVYNQRNVKVVGNLVDKTAQNGISVSQAGINISVENNTVLRAGTRGIIVSPLEQSGNYLRLWTEALLSDGISLAYVHQHQPAVLGNTVRSSGTDGVYVAGSSSRYISEARVTGNHVYAANRTLAAGVTGVSALLLDKAVVQGNYVGGAYPGASLTNYATSGINSIVTNNAPFTGTQTSYIASKKHTLVGASPTSGTWELADVAWNQNPQSGTPLLWVCATAGTMGTLNGGATTGSIASGSTSLTVSSVTGLSSGAYITIVGITGKKKIMAITGTNITLDTAADATVSGAAVAFSAASFRATANL